VRRPASDHGICTPGGTIFSLSKWYVDGVDASGRVVIAYWARLAMRDVGLTWHALTEYADEDVARDWSVATVLPPVRDEGRITWQSEVLDLSLHLTPRDAPCTLTLLESPAGAVEWHSDTMTAALRLERRGRPAFEGTGYAECLSMTLPPWQLPIDTVDWGHWSATDHSRSSTWFRWRGAHPLTIVVEDGRRATSPSVDGTTITTEHSSLDVSPVRLLERRHLGEVLSPIPLLARAVPSWMLRMQETKWLGHAVRRDVDGTARDGWAVFERVTFGGSACRQ